MTPPRRSRRATPPGTVRLWTFQPPEVWERLRAAGTLHVDPTHPHFMEDFTDFRHAYDWLRERMAERIPGYGGRYPWWAYAEREVADLRRARFWLPPGERRVRLELAVSAERVLLSAYGDWHCVLNRWYLPAADAGDAAWEPEIDAWDAELRAAGVGRPRAGALPEPWESRMRESWERIFDPARFPRNTLQATFEELRLSDVLAVREFVCAGRHD